MSAPTSTVTFGVIGGSGNDELPAMTGATRRTVTTAYGDVEVVEGQLADTRVLQVSRHGSRHVRLSNHVNHRANLAALIDLGATAVVGLTVCGAVDPDVPLGSLIVFDDLYFPSNRLPDGQPCTWYTDPGGSGRGHWIFDRPFSPELRDALLTACPAGGVPVVPAGVYGHVAGPRFNSRTEISGLRTVGVTAVSQTGGPEAVLAGEAEIPYALLGFVTDYANGVTDRPEPVAALLARMATSPGIFAAVVEKTIANLDRPAPAGIVHRFDP